MSVLHVVVVSLLLGAILVIVGLVQLTPNADASQHRYLLLGAGGTLLIVGILLAVLRCFLLPWRERRLPTSSAASVTAGGGQGSCCGLAPVRAVVLDVVPRSFGAGNASAVSVAASGAGSDAGTSSTAPAREGHRSRTNSTTNGQVSGRQRTPMEPTKSL